MFKVFRMRWRATTSAAAHTHTQVAKCNSKMLPNTWPPPPWQKPITRTGTRPATSSSSSSPPSFTNFISTCLQQPELRANRSRIQSRCCCRCCCCTSIQTKKYLKFLFAVAAANPSHLPLWQAPPQPVQALVVVRSAP